MKTEKSESHAVLKEGLHVRAIAGLPLGAGALLSVGVVAGLSCRPHGELASLREDLRSERPSGGATTPTEGLGGDPAGAVASGGAAPGTGDSSDLGGPAAFRQFEFPPPRASALGRSVRLWATHYYIPTITASPQKTVPIRDGQEQSVLGDQKISAAEWCDLAKQGSGLILPSVGRPVVVGFATRSKVNPMDCWGISGADGRPVVGRRDVAETIRGNRFEVVQAVFARGARVGEVIPFRTIAVKPDDPLSYGNVIYIPEARGQKVTLGDGQTRLHDGYFFVGDTGGSLAPRQIDINTGLRNERPFSFVRSTPEALFDAQIVQDGEIVQKLKEWHRFRPVP